MDCRDYIQYDASVRTGLVQGGPSHSEPILLIWVHRTPHDRARSGSWSMDPGPAVDPDPTFNGEGKKPP
jgi:hypothetical protein